MSQLERFTHGDTDAFEHLFRQFQGQVFAWIVRIVRDRGVAEDLTNLVRRHPIPSVLIALGVGFCIARVTTRS